MGQNDAEKLENLKVDDNLATLLMAQISQF